MGKTYRRRSDEDHSFKRVKKKKRTRGKGYNDDSNSSEGNADYLEWQEKLDRQDRRG